RLRLARDDLFHDREAPRHALHGAGREAAALDAVAVHDHRRRYADEREVPGVAVGYLLEIEARAGPIGRQANRREHLAGLEHGHALDVDVRPDEEILRRDLALAARADDAHARVEDDERGRRVGRGHGDAAIRAEQAVLAVLAFRRIGVAALAARAIAIDAVAVVPAACVLADVAADRARIADLRARDLARGLREHAVTPADQRIRLDLGQRRQRADLDAAVGRLTDAAQRRDAVQIDEVTRTLHAVLEPVEAVVAARERPTVRTEAAEQLDGTLERIGLI